MGHQNKNTLKTTSIIGIDHEWQITKENLYFRIRKEHYFIA